MESKVYNEKEQNLSYDELISRHQYLVTKIAQQFKDMPEPESQMNLEEVGYLGLLNAAQLYDSKIHKVNFKTYAQILITEEIHRYLLNRNRRIDCPDWLMKLNELVNDFVIKFRDEHHRFPEIQEIASHFNITENGIQEVLKARDSLKETSLTYSGKTQVNFAFPKPDIGKIKSRKYQSFKLPIEDVIVLRRAFQKIVEIKKMIIYYLFIMDLNQTKLARMLGITSEKEKRIKEELIQNIP